MASERPLSNILQDILRNLQDIVRSELRLAKTEVQEELAKGRSASLLVAIGASGVLFAVFFILLGCAYALGAVMPMWAAALCVAAGIGIVAVVALGAGLTRFKTVRAAPKTVASIKENIEWAKRQTK